MQIVLITLVFLLIIFAAMAVGVMLGRGPIKGSCGGIAALTGERTCDLCGGDRVRCDEINGGSDEQAQAKANVSAETKVGHFDPRAPR